MGTLFTVASGQIFNFSLTPNNSQLWYFKSTTSLYCYDLSSGKSWCDNTTNHFQLAGGAGFYVSVGPNQITFKDDETMFISTNNGEILRFDLPVAP